MKVLNDDGPLRIEDLDDRMRVVHKASGDTKLERRYMPGSIASWTEVYSRMVGFREGWSARKEAQYKGEAE